MYTESPTLELLLVKRSLDAAIVFKALKLPDVKVLEIVSHDKSLDCNIASVPFHTCKPKSQTEVGMPGFGHARGWTRPDQERITRKWVLTVTWVPGGTNHGSGQFRAASPEI